MATKLLPNICYTSILNEKKKIINIFAYTYTHALWTSQSSLDTRISGYSPSLYHIPYLYTHIHALVLLLFIGSTTAVSWRSKRMGVQSTSMYST